VGGSDGDVTGRWALRTVPSELVARYVSEGWWTDDSLGDLVAEGLAALADEPFVVHSATRPWRGTIGELDAEARRFAGALRDRGIGPGDVVVFQLPNWKEAAVTFWGSAYAGVVLVPVVHFYGTKELAYILEVTQPALVITPDRFGTRDLIGDYAELLGASGAPWAVVGDTAADQLPAGVVAFDALLDAEPVEGPVDVDPDAPTIVAFTSGTTRDPKGVVHTHRTLGFESRQLSAMSPTGPPSITGAPVGHFIGMLSAFLCSLLRHQGIQLIDVWDPGEVLRLMLAERVSVGGGATYFVTSLLDHPDFTEDHLALMPTAGLGGAPVPVAVTERLAGLGIAPTRSYGSTEHPSITGSYMHDPERKRMTTDGHPLPGVEVRLDPSGQILSRGPDLFLGYTDASLTDAVVDREGWYHTGDVGVLDEDGYLTITDRTSDVIIRGGENISAQEVEELLMGLDGVAEVAVVAEPDARLGEHAAAVLRVRDGATPPTLDDVRRHLADAGLAKQKWPESIHVVDELPRTPSGKVQKFRLRQQLGAGPPTAS
jgi:acyl-CoA synthetase (AMP-forming)/AMP-acid ligase II